MKRKVRWCVKGMFFHLLSIVFVITEAKNGCREFDYLPCIKNKTLTEHVIKSLEVSGATGLVAMCQRECFNEGQCVSYNLGPVNGHARTCELSGADHWMRPNSLVSKEDFEYCPIKNPCSSSPCPANRLCTPDFSWDTFSCDDGGWTQWGSWTICSCDKQQIRERSCSNPAPQNNGLLCVGQAQETKKCLQKIEFKHIGCFGDSGVRALPIFLHGPPKPYSICSCGLEAYKKGYEMFGVQYYGNDCWTSTTARTDYNIYGPVNRCPSTGLGAGYANDIYEIIST